MLRDSPGGAWGPYLVLGIKLEQGKGLFPECGFSATEILRSIWCTLGGWLPFFCTFCILQRSDMGRVGWYLWEPCCSGGHWVRWSHWMQPVAPSPYLPASSSWPPAAVGSLVGRFLSARTYSPALSVEHRSSGMSSCHQHYWHHWDGWDLQDHWGQRHQTPLPAPHTSFSRSFWFSFFRKADSRLESIATVSASSRLCLICFRSPVDSCTGHRHVLGHATQVLAALLTVVTHEYPSSVTHHCYFRHRYHWPADTRYYHYYYRWVGQVHYGILSVQLFLQMLNLVFLFSQLLCFWTEFILRESKESGTWLT